jgi:hypothetical protein
MTKSNCIIPAIVQDEIHEQIDSFNKKHLARKSCKYVTDIKGKFIYLMYLRPGEAPERVSRLTYNGDLKNMSFAIFKYSSETYSSSEMFPGDGHVNGTLEGAMKAGLEAYPI